MTWDGFREFHVIACGLAVLVEKRIRRATQFGTDNKRGFLCLSFGWKDRRGAQHTHRRQKPSQLFVHHIPTLLRSMADSSRPCRFGHDASSHVQYGASRPCHLQAPQPLKASALCEKSRACPYQEDKLAPTSTVGNFDKPIILLRSAYHSFGQNLS